jgi:VanZ family protein
MTKLIKKLSEPKTVLFISVIYTILITIAFLSPVKGTIKLDFFIPLDKVIHVSFYLALSFLWLSYLYVSGKITEIIKTILGVIIICFIYGTVIEVIQELWVPSRGADLLDVMANTIGAILGSFLFWNIKNRIKS